MPRSQGAEGRADPAKRRPGEGEPRAGGQEGPAPAREEGRDSGTHLSVKSSGRSSSRRVREGGVGDGRGQLRGVQGVGSPRFWGRGDQSRSGQVIYRRRRQGDRRPGSWPQQPALGTGSGSPPQVNKALHCHLDEV